MVGLPGKKDGIAGSGNPIVDPLNHFYSDSHHTMVVSLVRNKILIFIG